MTTALLDEPEMTRAVIKHVSDLRLPQPVAKRMHGRVCNDPCGVVVLLRHVRRRRHKGPQQ